jgi:hypothetical protein
MTNENDDDASRPRTMMTTMTMMTMSCQFFPFFIGFFIVWLFFIGWPFWGSKYGCHCKPTQTGANIINFVLATWTHLAKIEATSCVGTTCCQHGGNMFSLEFCCVFVLLWMDSRCHKLIVCKKWHKNNLKMRFMVLLSDPPSCAPHPQEMLQEAQKAHNEAVTKMYGLLRNLLSGDLQSQWDWVCCKMHKHDLWAEVNGQITTGRHPCLSIAF